MRERDSKNKHKAVYTIKNKEYVIEMQRWRADKAREERKIE